MREWRRWWKFVIMSMRRCERCSSQVLTQIISPEKHSTRSRNWRSWAFASEKWAAAAATVVMILENRARYLRVFFRVSSVFFFCETLCALSAARSAGKKTFQILFESLREFPSNNKYITGAKQASNSWITNSRHSPSFTSFYKLSSRSQSAEQ